MCSRLGGGVFSYVYDTCARAKVFISSGATVLIRGPNKSTLLILKGFFREGCPSIDVLTAPGRTRRGLVPLDVLFVFSLRLL